MMDLPTAADVRGILKHPPLTDDEVRKIDAIVGFPVDLKE